MCVGHKEFIAEPIKQRIGRFLDRRNINLRIIRAQVISMHQDGKCRGEAELEKDPQNSTSKSAVNNAVLLP